MSFKISAYQHNATVGAIESNAQAHIRFIRSNPNSDLCLFPELSLTGYSPEDLLFRPDLYRRINESIQCIVDHMQPHQMALVGHPSMQDGMCFNTISILTHRGIKQQHHKRRLPNYAVFDEKRYFSPGNETLLIEQNQHQFALLLCEELWHDDLVHAAVETKAKTILALNASPYALNKQYHRLDRISRICRQHALNCIYLNCVGGQDETVFDGQSFAVNASGHQLFEAALCQEDEIQMSIHEKKELRYLHSLSINRHPDKTIWTETYEALKLGIRDYVEKNHFPHVLLGLSGGVDSALVCALATDALGPDRVKSIMMPSRHTSIESLSDARKQAELLGIDYQIMDIEPTYQSFLNTLADRFKSLDKDTTEENIQARCRGTLLMALSNKMGGLVLTTGNKSELAVGYSTLYGDMAGGFAPIKDLYKSDVYKLCHYRNSLSAAIVQNILTKAPSAELADNQKDQDTLPEYDQLDAILRLSIDQRATPEEIEKAGYNRDIIDDTIRRLYRNEYKRRQGPIGIRVSQTAFGKDRRYPITNHFNCD